MARPAVNIVDRLYDSIVTPLDDNQCWITSFTPERNGYCRIYSGRMPGGQRIGIHRLMYEVHYGEPIPEGMVVMHSCDNPACVNPAHLSLGTTQDNMTDKCRKGRHKNGHSPGCTQRLPKRGANGQWLPN